MTVKIRKKNTRQIRTTGWGHKKKHRGRGSRGGQGRAGLHKHKFNFALKNKLFDRGRLSPSGFTRHASIQWSPKTINIGQLDEMVPRLLEEKKAIQKGNTVEIDLTALGIEKLLGSGKIIQPLIIKVLTASDSAKEKLAKAGGRIAE